MINFQNEKIDLSVVVIAKNEDQMIGECIESIIVSLNYAVEKKIIRTHEIVLADSASTDRTIEIAKKYPIKIVQLNKKWPLSAAAGRYIGYLNSKGNYVFFIDGDNILDREWFYISIPYLNDESIAGVDGIEKEYIDVSSPFYDLLKSNDTGIKNVIEIDIVGKAIFKRNVLNEVGAYNPYLIGGEDRDISYRIRAAGYKLLRIPSLCVTHYWAKKDGKLTLKRVLESVYVWSKGDGEALRYSFGNKKIAKEHILRYFNTNYIKIYGIILLFISYIYMNILTILLFPRLQVSLIFTLFIDVILLVFGLAYAFIRYKGGKWNEFIFSFHVIPYVLTRHMGFIIGFLKLPKDPKKYPTDAYIIKDYEKS